MCRGEASSTGKREGNHHQVHDWPQVNHFGSSLKFVGIVLGNISVQCILRVGPLLFLVRIYQKSVAQQEKYFTTDRLGQYF